MKWYSPPVILALIISIGVALLPQRLAAQRSAAELISTIAPPQGDIDYTDGVRQVLVHGQYLYITNFWAGLQVVDISDVANPRQVAFMPTEDEAYHTDIAGDYAYLASHASGVQIYDISDPTQMTPVALIDLDGNAFGVRAVDGRLYVAMGEDGFAIVDVTDPRSPSLMGKHATGEWVQHVDVAGNRIYMAAKKGGLLVYDVSSPASPRKLSQYRTGYNTMMVQVADQVAYLADGSGGLVTIDVKRPDFPVEMGRFQQVGFVHGIHKVGTYCYLANRDVGLQIVNVIDPAAPFQESLYATDDKAYGVFKKDIYVFLAANTATMIMRHNNSPVLADIPDPDLQENQLFDITMDATEPDGDPIVYEISNAPDGSTFDPATGQFSWTPTYEQSGVYPGVIFRVIEQTESQLSAADTVTLTVAHVNRLPDLPAIANQTIAENATLTVDVPEGSDPDVEDQQRLAYRAENLPDGASFDPVSRQFAWTPTFEQSGSYVVDFLLDDGGGGIDREPITIDVTHVDRPPVIEPILAQGVAEQQPLTVPVGGSEPDSEDVNLISYRMENLPEGAVFDAATQTFSWTPSYDQSGEYTGIRAIMTAGDLRDTTVFAITVDHVNRAPSLAAIGDQQVDENQELRFTISGSDEDVEDSGKLAYSAANLPPGSAFDAATQTFSWTPTFEQSGAYPDVTFAVQDPDGLVAEERITITVDHVNRVPVIAAASDQAVDESNPLTVQFQASDPDAEDSGALVYSALSLPDGATLDPASGQLSWTPTYDQSGEYPLTVVISDGRLTDTTALTVSVAHVNRTPVLDPVPGQTVDENAPLTFTLTGSDPDTEDAGLLTYSAAALPEGATFDPATLTFEWTPTYEQSGVYEVTFTVQDPAGLSASQSTTITVNHVNRAPALAAIPAQTVDENSPLTLVLQGSDPDAEDAGKLSYTVIDPVSGVQVAPAEGALSWTPTFEQSGTYTIMAQVSDPDGLTAQQPIAVTVNHVNRPPEFAPIAAQEGLENEPLSFTVSATDPDAEDAGKLTYSATGLPEGATLDPASGAVQWTPTYEQSGDYPVTFQVTDSENATATVDVAIAITHVNRTPTLAAVPPAELTENTAGTVDLPDGGDPDAEDAGQLTYRVDDLPAGAVFDAAARVIRWTPAFDQSGSYEASYVVSDGELEAAQPVSLNVVNVNRPPAFADVPAVSGNENEPITFTAAASDPDGEDAGNLRYSATGLPEGASLDDASGAFSWTPGYEQSGDYSVIIEVRDTFGEAATVTVPVSVAHVNRAPQLADVNDLDFAEDKAGSHTLPEGSDPDAEDAGKLTYSLEGLPAGAAFDAGSRSVSWTPGYDQAGEYAVRYVVSDGSEQASASLNLVVEDVNRAPQLASPGNQSVREGQEVKFQVAASDPDAEDTGNLSVEAKGLPDGARFDSGNSTFVWTPDSTQEGSYDVVFSVKDRGGLSANATVTIQVDNAPESPPTP